MGDIALIFAYLKDNTGYIIKSNLFTRHSIDFRDRFTKRQENIDA